MVGKPKVNNFDILNSLTFSNGRSCRVEILIIFFVFEHDHDILWLKVPVDNAQTMKEDDCLDDVANNEGALEFVEMFPFLDVLEQILAIDVLSYYVLEVLGMDGLLILDDLRVV